MTYIDVNIGYNKMGNFRISVKNDGEIIPLTFDTKEKLYIPELILGNLLTGSNFDDTEVYICYKNNQPP
jgi:DNA gyrase/topoisomerase IV subunit B